MRIQRAYFQIKTNFSYVIPKIHAFHLFIDNLSLTDFEISNSSTFLESIHNDLFFKFSHVVRESVYHSISILGSIFVF